MLNIINKKHIEELRSVLTGCAALWNAEEEPSNPQISLFIKTLTEVQPENIPYARVAELALEGARLLVEFQPSPPSSAYVCLAEILRRLRETQAYQATDNVRGSLIFRIANFLPKASLIKAGATSLDFREFTTKALYDRFAPDFLKHVVAGRRIDLVRTLVSRCPELIFYRGTVIDVYGRELKDINVMELYTHTHPDDTFFMRDNVSQAMAAALFTHPFSEEIILIFKQLIEKKSELSSLLNYLPEILLRSPDIAPVALRHAYRNFPSQAGKLLKQIYDICHEDLRQTAFQSYLQFDDAAIARVCEQDATLLGLPGDAKRDPTMVFNAVRKDRRAVRYVPAELHDVAGFAVIEEDELREKALACYLYTQDWQKNGLDDTERASKFYQIAHAVKQTKGLFEFLSEDLRNRKVICLYALIGDRFALNRASSAMIQWYRSIGNIENDVLRTSVCECLLSDNDESRINSIEKELNIVPYLGVEAFSLRVVLFALGKTRIILSCFHWERGHDVYLQKIAEIQDDNLRAKACACYLNRHDADYVTTALIEEGRLLPYLWKKDLYSNKKFAIAALRLHRNQFQNLSYDLQVRLRLAHEIVDDVVRHQALESCCNPGAYIYGMTWMHYCIEKKAYEALSEMLKSVDFNERIELVALPNVNGMSVLAFAMQDEYSFNFLVDHLPESIFLDNHFIQLVQTDCKFARKAEMLQKYYFGLIDQQVETKPHFFITDRKNMVYTALSKLVREKTPLPAGTLQALEKGEFSKILKAWASCMGKPSIEALLNDYTPKQEAFRAATSLR